MAWKRSRSAAVIEAQATPPSTPASRMGTTISLVLPASACIATQPAASAPATNWPSAPMFQTLARKATASPSAISTSGVAFSPSSPSA